MKIIDRFKLLTNKVSKSLDRFPVALGYAFLAVVMSIFINHSNYGQQREVYNHIAMALALGIPMSLAFYTFFERNQVTKQKQLLAHGVGAIVLGAYYFLLLKDMEMVTTTRYIAYNIALYLVASSIPYFFMAAGLVL